MDREQGSQDLAHVTVIAGNPVTQISIVDGGFQRLATGFGRLTVGLSPGAYRVDLLAGNTASTQFEVITHSQVGTSVEIVARDVTVDDTVPLVLETSTDAPRDAAALAALAQGWSQQLRKVAPSASRVFVFGSGEDAHEQSASPLSNVSLHVMMGSQLLNIDDASSTSVEYNAAGAGLPLDPGTYLLRTRRTGFAVEQSIPVFRGWATNVFMRATPTDPDDKPGPDPTLTSVLVTRDSSDLDLHSAELTSLEMLRIALQDARRLVTADLLDWAMAPENMNPLAVLLAAHLLTITRDADQQRSAVAAAASQWIEMFGPCADAVALRLWAGSDVRSLSDAERSVLAFPPLLRNSWRLLTLASTTEPRVIPRASKASSIAGNLWGGGVWLLWTVPEVESNPVAWYRQASSRPPSTAQVTASISAADAVRGGVRENMTSATTPSHDRDRFTNVVALSDEIYNRINSPEMRRRVTSALSSVESALVDYILSAKAELQMRGSERGAASVMSKNPGLQVSAKRLFSVGTIVRSLGVPAGSVADALNNVAAFLDIQDEDEAVNYVDESAIDTQKGKFGGSPRANGREMTASIRALPREPDWFEVNVQVTTTDTSKPLTGSVRFFLHETFSQPEVERAVENGVSVWRSLAWGAFTIGATCDDGRTRLELDLAELTDAPSLFRSR